MCVHAHIYVHVCILYKIKPHNAFNKFISGDNLSFQKLKFHIYIYFTRGTKFYNAYKLTKFIHVKR